jgi:hypothetical protein
MFLSSLCLTVDTYQRWRMGGHGPSAFVHASLMELSIDHDRKNPKSGWTAALDGVRPSQGVVPPSPKLLLVGARIRMDCS